MTNADRESKLSEGELGKVKKEEEEEREEKKEEEEKEEKLMKPLLKIRTDDHIGLYDYIMK